MRKWLLVSISAVAVALLSPMAHRFLQKVKEFAASAGGGSSSSGSYTNQQAPYYVDNSQINQQAPYYPAQQAPYYPANSQSNPQAPYYVDHHAAGGTTPMAHTGKVNVAYFTNWSIYGQKYHPNKVPYSSLTHILYAFADIKDDGTVFLTDAWSDVDIHYDGDSWEEQGKKLFGNFKQFAFQKRRHRHLKLLLSIGGWSFSSHFKAVLNPQGRQRFVESAMKILEDVGLDGLDVDWEYPQNASEAQAYVDLLAALRQALDQRQQAMGEAKHWLSIAAPAGEARNTLKVREMDQYLDLWNLMAYDFTGTWSDTASHHANIFPSPQARTPTCADEAVSFFVNQGVNPAKIVLGMPLYSRAFANCRGGIGSSFQGVPEGGSEPGLFFYKDLPLPGHQEYFDDKALAWYSTDQSGSQFVSYEGPPSVDAKADYIQRRGLAGAMWWELGGDAEDLPRALVPRVAYRLGNLDQSNNNLHFPGSQYENVRNGQF